MARRATGYLINLTVGVITYVICAKASAFPEMIRNHYINCSACHVSQSGGGVLNPYGRSLSYELLSTWGSEKEARAFYSVEVDPEKVDNFLNLGGDLRGVQTHYENQSVKQGKYFVMQAGIDAALTAGKWTAMMTIGQWDTVKENWREVSPKYFLSYQFSDEFSLRAGRTIPIFGLQIPQHTFLIKDNLLIGQGTERNSVETFWNGQEWNFSLAYARSDLQSYVRDEEKSTSVHIAKAIKDSNKIGVSYWNGDAQNFKRTMYGVDGVFGFSEKFYLLGEMDRVTTTSKPANVEITSDYELLKLGYEFHKGVHGQVVQQFVKPNIDSSGEIQSYGAGVIWYPRPHLEFEGLWQKQRTLTSTSDVTGDSAYLLVHFYF